MAKAFWLFKTEPEVYSFETLLKEKKTFWNGVRNHQAKNFLKEVQRGDEVLIYHSGEVRSVVGIAEVIREAYPDPDPKKKGDWLQVDIKPLRSLKRPISLKEIKSSREFSELLLLKQSRLSVMPISAKDFRALIDKEKMSHSDFKQK